MSNLSFKDNRYFIDGHTYNCPICDRNNLPYKIVRHESFRHGDGIAHLYVVQCSDKDCWGKSLHISKIYLDYGVNFGFSYPPKRIVHIASGSKIEELGGELDDYFIYHSPSSYFILDERIPARIRRSLSEAENCRVNGFLTGGTACLRKTIYLLFKEHDIPERLEDQDGFLKYADRLQLLMDHSKFKHVDSALLKDLESVHFVASQELHENDWENFDATTLRFLLQVVQEVLYERYVLPEEKSERKRALSELKKKTRIENA